MKTYNNQTEQSANLLGLGANFVFCSDEGFCPNGIDEMTLTKDGQLVHHEVSVYNKETNTATIYLMSNKEYKDWLFKMISTPTNR